MIKGLYRKEFEKDACGIGFIASIKNLSSHDIVSDALSMLYRMEHRGGVAADDKTGDGAGIMTQIPHDFFKSEAVKEKVVLPEKEHYGVAMVFVPNDDQKALFEYIIYEALKTLGLECFWVRKVKTNVESLGPIAKSSEPSILQYFIEDKNLSGTALNRRLYLFRKMVELESRELRKANEFYMSSCSTKTIVYKGELRTWQLNDYYHDLNQKNFQSSFAIVHSRFSTNTLPEWRLAQPFRYIAHNGEINTIRGNINKMLSRERLLRNTHFTKDELDILLPICQAELSDSANLDLVVELLLMGGRSLDKVMSMLIPPAWKADKEIVDDLQAFYEYHELLVEPWDGPAALCFTDGDLIGACVDRNGLRPGRFSLTKDDKLVFASETGVVDLKPSEVLQRGKLGPGEMLLIDLSRKVFENDVQIKRRLCTEHPYREWHTDLTIKLSEFCAPQLDMGFDPTVLLKEQLTFGYSKEDLKFILKPMSNSGVEPIGSMGNDTPLAVFAKRSVHVADYLKQLFAQVSNPAIDPIREKAVMSLKVHLGASNGFLDENTSAAKKMLLDQPILMPNQVRMLEKFNSQQLKGGVLRTVYNPKKHNLHEAIELMMAKAKRIVEGGVSLLVVSNRPEQDTVPIPSLLIIGAIHHHLVSCGIRSNVSLIVEAGDVIETHHFATLIGYGASAVCPYLAFQSVLSTSNEQEETAIDNYTRAINYGLRKVLSKMGISTLQSYEGAQVFESIGLSEEVTNLCFRGTVNRISGKSFKDLERDLLGNYQLALNTGNGNDLPETGIYQWRNSGEKHLFNPETIHLLQKATKLNDLKLFRAYSAAIDNQVYENVTLRSLLTFKSVESVPITEVEPAKEIMKRFATGAMSFGSISEEAHTTIAKAMNLIGGKSNSGEGGEDAARFVVDKDGSLSRSAIKQVASGRFGVTTHYLVNADEIQIKIAQGAKPGEGGQLPGLKVDENIARLRFSTPGVTLISPPPHHDIYSIEDLAQLIFDLKNVNPKAEINVKLVAEAGVGTIAAGVAKANADNILISGYDGGTGASPLSSVQHAGTPWELGLAEAHQTLMHNGLRNRVKLQTDGQIKTARDLVIATILGAEEWGVATAVLIVQGCVMMRKCHLNTCPVGIATQNRSLRKLFTGEVDHIVNFFTLMAEELRVLMATLGVRTVNELVGRTDLLEFDKSKADQNIGGLNLSPILYNPWVKRGHVQYKTTPQRNITENILDDELIRQAMPAFKEGKRVRFKSCIENINRTAGAKLSGRLVEQFGPEGLADGTITVDFQGTTGQSFGAFLSQGITFNLEGAANDYVAKGLSGGKLTIYPSPESICKAADNVLIGNVALYGATRGNLYVNGRAGERFAVRNSGANAVVEGVGDHGCEYMTGGRVIILGETGRNFAAGMSGGISYIFVQGFDFHRRCNMEMVVLEQPQEEDIQFLYDMIQKHHRYTKSVKAFEILSQWNKSVTHFVKVIPVEFKKVMEEKRSFKNTLV